MTNEQLTWGFIALATHVVGVTLSQYRTNRVVERRFVATRTAIDMVLDKVVERDDKNKILIEGVVSQLRDILRRMPRKDKESDGTA